MTRVEEIARELESRGFKVTVAPAWRNIGAAHNWSHVPNGCAFIVNEEHPVAATPGGSMTGKVPFVLCARHPDDVADSVKKPRGSSGWFYGEEGWVELRDALDARRSTVRDELREVLAELTTVEAALERRVPLPPMPESLSQHEKEMLLVAMKTGAELVVKLLVHLSEEERAKGTAVTGNHGAAHQLRNDYVGRSMLLAEVAKLAQTNIETSLEDIRVIEGLP